MKANGYPWGTFVILVAAALCGLAASFPFVFSVYAELIATAPFQPSVLVLMSIVQNTVLMGLLVGFGLKLTAKVGLPGAPLIEDWRAGKNVGERFRAMILPALMTGVGVGAMLLVLMFLLLQRELPQLPIGKAALMPVWKRLLICLYGGLTEEILMRVFLFSLLAWLVSKVWRGGDGKPGRPIFWAANIILALLFGLGHLGSVVPLMPITFNVVVAALVLNTIASLAFTHLYLRRGLETAMLAHFTADFLIFVIGPSFIQR
jgi:hypothetical protein